MLTLDLAVELIQIFDELFLLRLLTENSRHVLSQCVDYVGVNFGQPESHHNSMLKAFQKVIISKGNRKLTLSSIWFSLFNLFCGKIRTLLV